MNRTTILTAGFLVVLLGPAPADIIVNAGAELKVAGSVTTGTVQTTVGSKLSGIGTINGSVTGSGDLAPGTTAAPYGTLVLNGSVATTGSYLCDLSGASVDKLSVAASFDITNMTLVLPSTPESFTEAVYLISSYGTLSGASFASVQNTPSGYKLIYAHDAGTGATNIALVQLSAFEAWAVALSLPTGENGANDDPNGDGLPNIIHFAFDTDPLGDGSDERKVRLTPEDVGGIDYLTLTLPVRTGATFSGDSLVSGPVDGLIYSILGDTDLEDPWDLEVVELVSALDTGLPALGDYDSTLGADWEYRSFRLSDPVSAHGRAFMKTGVTSAP